jgi:O-antigen/teichoic acid export membrane protein
MSRLTKNIIYNLIGQILLSVISFVAVKYIFVRLGADALGIIFFAITMNAVLSAVFQLGISSTATREISAHLSNEPVYIHNFIRTASFFYWTAYILISVGIYYSAPFIVVKWINLTTMNHETAVNMLRILGIAIFVGLPSSLYTSIIRGLQRMEYNNFINVVTTAIQQIGIIVILLLGGSLFQVIYWMAILFYVAMVSYIFALSRFFPWRVFIPGVFFDVIKRNLKYATNMLYISLLAMVFTQSDKLIVSKLLPIGLLGYYSFAYAAVARSGILASAVSDAAFPLFSNLHTIGDNHNLLKQYHKLQDLVCFGIVPIFALIIFFNKPIFGYIFNSHIARTLFLPTTFLVIAFYMNGISVIPYNFLIAVGKPEIAAKISFRALFIVLPMTVVLIYLFGLNGAGFSWIFYFLVTFAYFIPRFCFECLKTSVWNWCYHIFKIIILTGFTYGATWLIVVYFGAYTLQSLSLAYLGASIVFLIGAYFIISDELRESLLQHFQSLRLVLIGF